MAYKIPKDIQHYLETVPAYQEYLKCNRKEHRYVRCEFPQLMGWNTLSRPEWLPRSLRYPYLDKPYGIQARNHERLLRPHINRVKIYRDSVDSHSKLKQADIILDDKALEKKPWGEIRIGTWAKNNARVLVKIFDKSKPEWEVEDQLLNLEICKSQSIAHINFVHYYGCIETKMQKYYIFEHLSRGNLLNVLRGIAKDKQVHSNKELMAPDDHTATVESVLSGFGIGGGSRKNNLNNSVLRKMFCQILFAISHLHDEDMVHRQMQNQI